jgi:uroporphyrinogen decarboxylase
MIALTSIERMRRTFERKPVDRLPVIVNPWSDTLVRWRGEGHLGPDEDYIEHFEQDVRYAGWLNPTADLDFEETVLEETEETVLTLDGNGARLRRHKLHEATPEHVGFSVYNRKTWEELARPKLLDFDRRRVAWEIYREEKKKAAENNRFFCWCGVGPFEILHPITGHENFLIGMAEDPDWVRDMVKVYMDLCIHHLEALFSEEGKPDGFYVFDDMGFKGRPFMSPGMYREIIQPGHQRFFDFAHSLGCPVMVHSCGFVEPLVPGLIEAGMDCLQAMEVKAGMDMPRLFQQFGDKISFCGNIDVRLLIQNDLEGLKEEMDRKIRPVIQGGGGYILHTDHSEPPEVDYETMKFFVERGRGMAA